MELRRIGDFSLIWGESLIWDDLRNRLYFVDCTSSKLYWLEDAELPLFSMRLSSMPTGVVLADDGRLVIALANGLNLVDPDRHSEELLANYPQELGLRANDATVDSCGNLVTGSLKESPRGSYWWYSNEYGWRKLDQGISNANGPVVLGKGKSSELIFADTPAQKLYSYGYDAEQGTATQRAVYADSTLLEGFPDGACGTDEGGVLSCTIGPGLIAHYNGGGLIQTFDAGSEQPADITFGGTNLDRLFVVSIKAEFMHGKPKSSMAGALIEIEGSGLRGRQENRLRLQSSRILGTRT